MTPEEMRSRIEAVRKAIADEGHVPPFHRIVMARHREEWPTLWKAIDALLSLESRPTTGKSENE